MISTEVYKAGNCSSFFSFLLWRWLVWNFDRGSSVFGSKISGLSVDVYGLHINENKQTKTRKPGCSKFWLTRFITNVLCLNCLITKISCSVLNSNAGNSRTPLLFSDWLYRIQNEKATKQKWWTCNCDIDVIFDDFRPDFNCFLHWTLCWIVLHENSANLGSFWLLKVRKFDLRPQNSLQSSFSMVRVLNLNSLHDFQCFCFS